MKYKSIEILIVGLLLTIIGLLTYLLIGNYSIQKDLKIKLFESYKAIQSQQEEFMDLILVLESSRKDELEDVSKNILTNFIDYSSCLAKQSTGVKNTEVIDAIVTICSPPIVEITTQFKTENPIFLNCFIEKGKMLARDDSVEKIYQACIEYENELSRQISISIQNLNN